MPFTICQTCGTEFWREPGEAWKKECLTCWQQRKRQENSIVARLERRILTLEDELEWTREQLAEAKAAGGIEPFLPFLIFVAHPDRNPKGKNEIATEATKWLLGLRHKMRIGGPL